MIILISGMPGAGKSAVARLLAKKFGVRHYSTGDIQRGLAKEHNMSITGWGELEAKDPSFDKMVDNRIKELLEKEDNIVVDSWIAPHFAKQGAIRIFLDCEELERARRRLPQKRATEVFDSLDKAIEDMRKRINTNRERWIQYYNYDFLDKANYDLIIDTTHLTPEQVAEKILSFIAEFT